VHIARELIQHKYLYQPPLWRGAPGKQFTPRRSLQRRAKAGADGVIQGRVFGVVLLGVQFGEPEAEDGVGVHGD